MSYATSIKAFHHTHYYSPVAAKAGRLFLVEDPAHGRDGGALDGSCLPRLPVHQWVLSVPKRLGYFLLCDGSVLNLVLRIFMRVIAQTLQTHSPGAANVDKATLHIGAVAFIHRLGFHLNEHVHFHDWSVDGVFEHAQGSYHHADKRCNKADELNLMSLELIDSIAAMAAAPAQVAAVQTQSSAQPTTSGPCWLPASTRCLFF